MMDKLMRQTLIAKEVMNFFFNLNNTLRFAIWKFKSYLGKTCLGLYTLLQILQLIPKTTITMFLTENSNLLLSKLCRNFINKTRTECQSPEPLNNGNVIWPTTDEEYVTVGQSISYSCSSGFTMNPMAVNNINCQSDGTFSSTLASQNIKCNKNRIYVSTRWRYR